MAVERDKLNPIDFDRHGAYVGRFSEITHELHAKCPIAWTETYGGHWVASGYREVFEIARDRTLLSNDHDIKGERKGYQGISIPSPETARGGFLEMDPPSSRTTVASRILTCRPPRWPAGSRWSRT